MARSPAWQVFLIRQAEPDRFVTWPDTLFCQFSAPVKRPDAGQDFRMVCLSSCRFCAPHACVSRFGGAVALSESFVHALIRRLSFVKPGVRENFCRGKQQVCFQTH